LRLLLISFDLAEFYNENGWNEKFTFLSEWKEGLLQGSLNLKAARDFSRLITTSNNTFMNAEIPPARMTQGTAPICTVRQAWIAIDVAGSYSA
jgi:hypothetical protein